MKKTIKIEGMSCMHCVGAVEKALNAVAGVQNVNVDLDNKVATVYVDGSITDEILREAIEDQGYDVISIS